MTETALSNRMREYAKTHAVPEGWHEAADRFDKATHEHMHLNDPTGGTARRMLGAFARARRLWCEETGESLI